MPRTVSYLIAGVLSFAAGMMQIFGIPTWFMIPVSRIIVTVVTFKQRSETKDKYGIRKDAFSDVMTAWCCTFCALAQHEQQVKQNHVVQQ
ncbi:Oidioi.mRNA.OKI2018_I69.chr2.g6840.t1.cds [Oikopleura dioica]|uniref:Oidioi.mRNA.OKI2018_I69.chr2.g6840.t1.cds n=1 Tax=Oikopleura dioica TaxID=34765 RepID=A0ABN7T826_OIKDI|nr:Oidioi.mRNA.OKI2018_I69.chr2.g6840.t1.cds [Oikopleura dioica]